MKLHLKGLNGEEEVSCALATAAWPCHPGSCPQVLVPLELLTASDPSAEGKGNQGGAAGSRAAWSLQVTLWVTLGHTLFLVSRKPTLLPTGGPGLP